MEIQDSSNYEKCGTGIMNISDLTVKAIGNFGLWQFYISLLMSLLKLSNAWYQLNIVFMAPPQKFWCDKPSEFSNFTDKEWQNISTPHAEELPCIIFDPDILITGANNMSTIPLVPCRSFVYDTSTFQRTMISEWNLVCENRWMVQLTQCVMMWGVLLGGVIFGALSDRFGRRKPLMAAIVIQAVTSFVSTTIPWFWIFLFNWFLLAMACGGLSVIPFVICIESLGGKWQMTVPILFQLPFGLGNVVMSLLAYWLRDWRKLEFSLASLSSLYLLYWFVVPESPRWLLVSGHTDEALETLRKIAKINKRKWNDDVQSLFPMLNMQRTKKRTPAFAAFFKSKSMRTRTMLLSITWFSTGLGFYTFAQYLGEIGSNMFMTVALAGIISTLGPIIGVFVITRCGRKSTVWVFQCLTVICYIAMLLTPREVFTNDWPRLLFAGIGFAGMAASVPALYLYTGELFPTLGRNCAVGGVMMFSRFGSMAAPAVISLGFVRPTLPLVLLVVTSFAQIFLLVPLPETKGKPLPDTLEQAEAIIK